MDERFTIIMSAFRAERTIVHAVGSVLAQTDPLWLLHVIADDGADYGAVLAAAGIVDDRIVHFDTGGVGSGSSHARNVGLDATETALIAILDADDRFAPGKLTAVRLALGAASLVSTALSVTDADFRPLRLVGAGPDRDLDPARYKSVNFSMDSMIAFDRRHGEARYDITLPCLTDLDFLIRLFEHHPSVRHLGTPLHDYVKQAVSISNGPGVAERMIATKRLLAARLTSGAYRLPDTARDGLLGFLAVSLEAERDYETALAARAGLLFEDHLEPLIAASTSVA